MTGTDTVPIRTEIRIQWVDIAKGITIILMIIGTAVIRLVISVRIVIVMATECRAQYM